MRGELARVLWIYSRDIDYVVVVSTHGMSLKGPSTLYSWSVMYIFCHGCIKSYAIKRQVELLHSSDMQFV